MVIYLLISYQMAEGYKVKKIYLGSQQVWPDEGYKPGVNTVAYYPLNSMTAVNDMSWNSRDLINNNVAFQTFWWVDCWYFNTSSYVYRNSSLFTWNPVFTVSLYARAISFSNINARSLWGIWGPYYNYSFWLFYWSDTATLLCVWARQNDKGTWYAGDTNWHHIVFAYSSWNWTIYVDWSKIYTWTRSPNIQNSKTVIWANVILGDWFDWYISEFIVENRARTSDEIATYFNKTKANYWL